MITLKNKIIIVSLLSVVFLGCCNSCKIVPVKNVLNKWPDYIDFEFVDKTQVSKDFIKPHFLLVISKACDDDLYSATVDFCYEYGYEYCSLSHVIVLEPDSDEIRRLNSGENVIKEYEGKPCKKLKIEGYDDYNIYEPPGGEMITYGLKKDVIVTSINIVRKR